MHMNILIVEDDRTLRECLALLFEDEGFGVRTAIDGQDALAQQQNLMADVILSDVTMPGMDGLKLLVELRRRGDRTPVVLMSAFSLVRASGHNECFIAKPFDLDALVSVVDRMAQGGNGSATSEH
jgi:DNA-binding NtrC family response regulator